MARYVEDFDLECADGEALAIPEETIELAAVALEIRRVEHRPENFLDVADVLADANLGAGLELEVGRARQVVGMGMGLEHPIDLEATVCRGLEDGIR